MLQGLRTKAQSIVAIVIIGFLILSFALWGVGSYLRSGSSNNIVAKVNKHKITRDDFNRTYQRVRMMQQAKLGADFQMTPQLQALLKQRVLQEMIMRLVLQDAALSSGLRISPQQIEQAIYSMPQFNEQGQFSPGKLRAFLLGSSMSYDQFIRDFQKDMLVMQVQSGIGISDFSTPRELNKFVGLINQKRQFSYLILNTPEVKMTANEAAIKSYYNAHSNQFAVPESVSIDYIQVSLTDIEKTIQPTESQLNAFYKSNLAKFTTPKQWKLQAASVAILNSTPEAESAAQKLAMQVQELMQSNKSLVSMEKHPKVHIEKKPHWVRENQLNTEVQKILNGMSGGNTVSAPTKVANRFVIYKVLETKPEKIQPYAQVKKQVLQAYRADKATAQYNSLVDKITNIAYEQPDSLEPVAKAANLKIITSKPFTKEGEKDGIASESKVVQMAFSDDVLTAGNNSDPVQLKNNIVIVLRVHQHTEASTKPLSQVRSEIAKQLEAQARNAAAQKAAAALVAKVKKQGSLKKIANSEGLAVTTTKMVGRFEQNIPDSILAAAFRLPSLNRIPVSAGLATLPDHRYVVVQLLKSKDGEVATLSKDQQKTFMNQISQMYASLDYWYYTQSQLKHAKVKVYQDVLDTV
ncbi:MAG: SurA N-terminal domain-containing protein [Gammaproteobacteria bacterium]